MKKNSVNTFTEGLICDLDPINVSNNVLTDCLNGTIITHDGNEYSLQNDKGNFPLKDCKLRENFIPVGIKEYNGILYIVSLNQYRENQYLFESVYDQIEVAENNLTPLIFKDTLALLNTRNIGAGDVRTIYFLTNSKIFNQNKLVFGNACDNIVNFSFNFNEPCFGILTNVGDYSYINVNVFTSFLSTINNLSNVVTKYSTQELRIVYELMTEDYKEE